MKIYLIRHGMPEGAEKGTRFLGRTDESLRSEGRDQADATGKMLSALGPGPSIRMVSSPLKRARETAEIINGHLGSGPIEVIDDLREIDLGAWDGRYVEDIKRDLPAEYEARGKDLWNYRIPGGETFAEAGARFSGALRGIAGRTSEDALAVVAHAGVIKSSLPFMTDLTPEEAMKIDIPYAGVIALSSESGASELKAKVEKIYF